MRILEMDCKQILEIDLKRAQGIEIDPVELQLYDEHLVDCPYCSMEKATLDAAAEETGSGALPPLDDLSRRRMVDEIIAKADEMAVGEPVDESHLTGIGRRTKVVWIGAAMAAAAVAAFVFWWTTPEPSLPDQSSSILASQTPVDRPDGRFSLLSGEVSVGRDNAHLGSGFMAGEELQTGDGRAVVDLKTGATLTLGPKTNIHVHWADGNATEVLLKTGQIQIYVDPSKKLSGFSVLTEKGRISVTGTIFSVSAGEAGKDAVEVRVLRGEVELNERGGKRRLSAGGATELGGSKTWTLSEDEEKSFWTEVRAVEMLDSSGNAVVEIESTPSGLDVAVDSVYLGKTPISASIRAGYRQLAVAVNERRVVEELIEIEPGSRLYRNFDLMDIYIEKDRLASGKPGSGESASRRGSTDEAEERLSAQELLRRAQVSRAGRDWRGAADAYEKLIGEYPESDEARASFVSLGQIELNKLGRPQSALEKFEKYLTIAKQGPLAQEALFGKALALKALERTEAEQSALNLFLTRFPSAIQAGEAKQRLSEIADETQK